MEKKVTVIGAGLAGCEAAYALAKRGVKVTLIEQKSVKKSAAHKSDNFCELVCSNSLKAFRLNSAAGLLKTEMEFLGSLTVPIAKQTAVPAGGALAVDREKFETAVTKAIKENENITVLQKEQKDILSLVHNNGCNNYNGSNGTGGNSSNIVIIATGPLTDGSFAESLKKLTGGMEMFSFYDAAAPIVNIDTVDMEHAFWASRYKDDQKDYLNCPLTKEEYLRFYNELINAERAVLHDMDKIYEGCMPIEVLAHKGVDTMRFGPLKAVGLQDPKTQKRPYANLQLRKETVNGNMYNLVGFQTNLKFGEQKRVFSFIPALKNAEYERYGVMHRNSFLNSPMLLNETLNLKSHNNIFIAGQLSGVEGYMESAASGIMCGINAFRMLNNKEMLVLPDITMMGGLFKYITTPQKHFQPMGAAFGLLPALDVRIKDKLERYMALAERSVEYFKNKSF